MKTIRNIFGVLLAMAVTTTLHSCSEEEVAYTPAEPESGTINAYFVGDAEMTLELEPGTTSFEIPVERRESAAAATIGVKGVCAEANVFNVPSSVTFEAGQTTAVVKIDLAQPTEGVYYNLSLCLEGETLSNYTLGNREMNVTFALLKWENIGTGYYLDGTVSNFFGVDPLMPMAVEIEKTKTNSSTRYRFESPFAKVATAMDEVGGYNGYPYNAEADLLPGKYVFTIEVTNQGASLFPTQMGMDWGYGAFSCGTVYGNLSSNLASYPLGIFNEAANAIIFPANSLYISMAAYNDGGAYPCATPTYLFLSADAYLAAMGQ